jgi:hypothetical protein
VSVDGLDLEYHLTPRGWKRGSSKIYGRADDEVSRPPDVIETWNLRAHQSSALSQEGRTVTFVRSAKRIERGCGQKLPWPFKATDIVK